MYRFSHFLITSYLTIIFEFQSNLDSKLKIKFLLPEFYKNKFSNFTLNFIISPWEPLLYFEILWYSNKYIQIYLQQNCIFQKLFQKNP